MSGTTLMELLLALRRSLRGSHPVYQRRPELLADALLAATARGWFEAIQETGEDRAHFVAGGGAVVGAGYVQA
jgi:hypothetical protein